MNGCSLEDAFQSADGAPSPGCTGDEGTRQARKEERRKARARSKCVAVADAPGKDPDRQHLNPLPDVPAMKGSEEPFHTYHKSDDPSRTSENPNPPTTYKYHKGPLEQYTHDQQRLHYMVMPINGHSTVAPKKFFGAQGPTDEPYADYLPDTDSHRLEPDFTQAFQGQGSGRSNATNSAPSSAHASSSSTSLLPPPALDMYWKPTTPSGAQTSFMETLLPPTGKYHSSSSPSSSLLPSFPASSPFPSSSSLSSTTPFHRSLRTAYENGEISPGELMKKLDMLFAKLDDMEYRSTPEQLTSEMLMFISSGIFVLFLMDLLVKRGGSMRF